MSHAVRTQPVPPEHVPWWTVDRGWHLAECGSLVICTAALAMSSISTPRLITGSIALTVLTAAYVVLGGPAFAEDTTRSRAYLLFAWPALLLLGGSSYPAGAIFVIILISQTWAALERRAALVLTTVGMVGLGVVGWASMGWARDVIGAIVLNLGLGLVFALCIGLFIDSLARTSRERAAALEDLRATQDQLAAAQRIEGRYAERARLSAEIHDTLAQGFTSVVTLSRAALLAHDRRDTERVLERLKLIESTAVENLGEARMLVAELAPADGRTLVDALQRVAATARRIGELDGSVEVRGDPVALGGRLDTALLRVAQEALSNTRKHSAASVVRLSLDYRDPGFVRLGICDDGCGFDVSGARSGYGLDSLRSRISEVGGEVEIVSTPGCGTRIRVRAPR